MFTERNYSTQALLQNPKDLVQLPRSAQYQVPKSEKRRKNIINNFCGADVLATNVDLTLV